MSERLSILFLNHVPQISGAEVGLLDLVTALDRNRFSAVVVLPSPGPLSDALTSRGATVAHIPLQRFVKTANPFTLIGYLINLIAVVPQLVRLIREQRIDIIHSNSTTAHIYGALAARWTGIPSIWHCRDLVNLGVLGGWLYRSSTRVIAISQAVARHLTRYGSGDKIATIHNGVDLELFRPAGRRDEVRRELGVAPDDRLVAMAGQLVPWKNHALFLRAANLIAAGLPAARFVIVGDDLFGDQGPYKAELQKLVSELELTDRVQFLGHRSDFARLLEGIDVLVHPAGNEPFGRVVAEAMAMAKPVVAVNSGGPAEIIRDGVDGILVPPQNPVEIASAVVRLGNDAQLASRLGVAARARIETDFSLGSHMRKMETLYGEIAGKIAPPSPCRVAYVVGEFPSISETFILREILALKDKGFDVPIFSLNRPSSLKVHAEAQGVLDQVHYPAPFLSGRMVLSHVRLLLSTPGAYLGQAFGSMLRGPRAIRNFWLAADFAATAGRIGIDHIHAHFAFMPTDIAMIMARLLGRRFSFSAHARDLFTQDAKALARKAAAAAFVVTCTQHGCKYLKKLVPDLPENRIVMIHHGISPEHFMPVASTRRIVLAVGRLEEKKGFAYLLKACGMLSLKGVDFSCVIVGSGSLEGELEEELLRCNASGSAVLAGEASQEELREFFDSAQMLVVPSVLAADGDRDGIPNVLLEAMARSLPIVATTAGAIREAVADGENGLLVPPADADALARAMERLLSDPMLRQRLGEGGRARVIRQFDISRNIETLARLFRKQSPTEDRRGM